MRIADDVDLILSGQFKGRTWNMTTADRVALGAILSVAHEGLHVWDADEKRAYHWSGTEWSAPQSGGGASSVPVRVVNSFSIPDNSQVLFSEPIDLDDGAEISFGENSILIEVS